LEQENLPVGWRLPSTDELSEALCGLRPSTPLQIAADFDSDGDPDVAIVAMNPRKSLAGVLAKLSASREGQWVVVQAVASKCATYGLAVAKAGDYRGFVCESIDTGCEGQEMKEFRAAAPGILFFEIGRSGMVAFWNAQTQAFDRVWEGD
jgi:hypothetical protein